MSTLFAEICEGELIKVILKMPLGFYFKSTYLSAPWRYFAHHMAVFLFCPSKNGWMDCDGL